MGIPTMRAGKGPDTTTCQTSQDKPGPVSMPDDVTKEKKRPRGASATQRWGLSDLRQLGRDGLSVEPESLRERMWAAYAIIACRRRIHPEGMPSSVPCLDCMKITKPLVEPMARMILIVGKQGVENVLIGRAVNYLIRLAEKGQDTWDECREAAETDKQDA